MRAFLISVAVLLCAVVCTGAESSRLIPLSPYPEAFQPTFRVTQQKSGRFTVELELPYLESEAVELEGELYQLLSIPGGGLQGEIGQAALPVISRLLALPDGATIGAEVTASDEVTLTGYRLWPQQPWSAVDRDQKQTPVVDTTYYEHAITSGEPAVLVGPAARIRDLRVVPVTFSPVRYDPVRGEVVVAHHMTVEIEISVTASGDEPLGSASKRRLLLPESFDKLYQQTILNYPGTDSEVGPGSYLLIYPNNAAVLARLEPLLQWRRQQGYNVVTVTTQETGTTTSAIKSYIQNAYDNWDIPLEFVVLAGDANGSYAVATWYEQLSGFTGEGDHYYTTLDGPDILPDIHIGRLSFRDLYTLEIIVDKIVSYESDPYLADDPDWFTRACLVGDPRDSGKSCIFVNQWVKNQLIDLNYTEIDTVWIEPFPTRMMTALNKGDTVFGYRGFWDMSGWTVGHTNVMTNGYKLPFVVTLTCGTGMFADEINTLSESFLRAEGGGGVAAIGTSTWGTHTRYNNVMYVGIMEGLLNSGDRRTGPALTRGKLEIYNQYWHAEPWSAEIWVVWNNLMGDPATDIWTALPADLLVLHPASLAAGASSVVVTVLDGGGQPLADAKVSLYKSDEILVAGYSDDLGQVGLPLSSHSIGSLAITVTKHDHKPYQGVILIGTAGAHVDFAGATVDDDDLGPSVGNGDGLANPGETIELSLQVANIGSTPVADITATMSVNDPYVAILTGEQSFTALEPGESAWSSGSYLFSIDAGTPGGHVIPFQLMVTSDSGTWSSLVQITVHAGVCVVEGFTWGGEGDTLDPGEAGTLSIELRNVGNLDISGATATLSSPSPWLYIPDAAGSYGMIGMGQTAQNSGDPFTVEIAPNCYPGHLAALNMALEFTGGGRDTVELLVHVGNAAAGDPIGPDGRGYYAFDDTDSDYPQAPVYEWVEIDPDLGGSGTSVGLSDHGVYQDDTEIVDLPFTFRYYGEEFDKISVCSNGWLCMGGSYLVLYRNYAIPCAGAPDNMLAVFWDDLYLTTSADVLTWYDAANDRFIVEWSQVRNMAGGYEVFQAILYDPAAHPTTTGDGKILYQYQDVHNVDSVNGYATVGIQNGNNSDGVLYTYWNRYGANAAHLTAGRAILFTPVVPVNASQAVGSVSNTTGGGSPIDGAIISFADGWSLASHSDGSYSGPVPPGNYNVTATHESFAPASEQNVTYITGETTVVDFQLVDILGPAITNTIFYVSTGDTLGPYVIETNITDYSPIAEIHFYYTSSTQGGPFELPFQLIDAGSGLYRIEIPGQPLGSSIQYWLTASDIAGNETSDPPGAPWENYRFAVADIVTIFTDDLESDLGWTVGDTYDNATSGIWERVDPNGVWEEDILVQPEDDATPDPGVMCYITGNDPPGSPQGTDDVDIGKTTLLSPWFDLSVNNDVTVSYKRWFTHDTGFVIEQEYWIVQVTNNGVDWMDLENTNVSERSWLPLSFLIEDYVEPSSSVRFRFIANDMQFDSIVEAGVDDFQLTGHTLVADAAAPAVAVLSPNGGENIFGGDDNTFPIAWDASDDIGVVMVAILLSTDGGQSWSDSLAGGPLSSPWEWQVPAINWQTCRIRIDCWDAVQNLSTDVSDADFAIQTAVSVDDLPVARVALHQNRPNPFNPRTEIRFALPAAQEINLKVYDLEGRLVRVLADGWQEAGEHTLYWHGENNHRERVASGIYFYRLITADRTITRKMALLK